MTDPKPRPPSEERFGKRLDSMRARFHAGTLKETDPFPEDCPPETADDEKGEPPRAKR